MAQMVWIVVLIALAALLFGRLSDHRADARAREKLWTNQPGQSVTFDPAMVADLPEAAQRYFLYTIAPGTPLKTVADISMSGQFGMGDKARPGYMQMSATQTLAMPTGFVWKMHARRGLMFLSGSDSEHWTRFWLMGLLPVARMGGDSDHTRSAFGRYVAEAVFWTPAAVLPGPGISWSALDANSARMTVSYRDMSQAVDITVALDGQPIQVRFERWSNANPQKQHRLQPFGGYLSEFRWFDGFQLPTHVEAGNHFDSDQYFPFFVVDVSEVNFTD